MFTIILNNFCLTELIIKSFIITTNQYNWLEPNISFYLEL
ncbi:hypothetical protein pb186bvf_009963 [Paramecium bursaria]